MEYMLNREERALLQDVLFVKATHVRYEERGDRFMFYNEKGNQMILSGCLFPNIPKDRVSEIQPLLEMTRPERKVRAKKVTGDQLGALEEANADE